MEIGDEIGVKRWHVESLPFVIQKSKLEDSTAAELIG